MADIGNWFVALSVVAPDLALTPPASVRAFAREDLHATLAFLGSIGETRARAGWDALSITMAAREIRLGPVRSLGASALASILDDSVIAHAIGATRDAITRAAGARLDERPPLPHVTVARIGRHASALERAAALAWADRLALETIPARVDRVSLYAGLSDRTTRMFRIVDSRPLR